MESVLVQAYSNHIPGELARKWQTGSIARMNRHHRHRNVTVFGMFFRVLQYVGTAPFFLHRMVIRFIQPFVLTGLALLWQIIVSNVIYIAVAVFVLLVILAYGLYRRYQEKQVLLSTQNVTPVGAKYMASKGGDDELDQDHDPSDEAFHMPNVPALTDLQLEPSEQAHSQSHSQSQYSSSSESSDSDASDTDDFVAHPRGGSVSSALRQPSLSESELSSTDLSGPRTVSRRVMRVNRAMSYLSDRSLSDESSSSSGEESHL